VDEPVELIVDGLWLRPPSVDEADDALAMLLDPETVRWNPAPLVADLDSARAWCQRGADWSDGSHATFSVLDLATARLLANVSVHEIDADHATASIGYRVAPWARGRGVATAALVAVTEWAFTTLGLARIQLFHHVANPASCRVATKAHFLLEGTLREASVGPDGTREDEHLHARLASDPWR
jgi:RimJ/RimL family protein N-acetyltransferase